ncbi:hypothetical protein QNH14_00110 [Apirhabdus apintestini]|nr:hypothetical protein QNH14_00110 [Enterobacteriaceae bacterium CA-0114]
MEIVCPKCLSAADNVDKETLKCSKCHSEFHKIKFRSTLLKVAVVMAVGGGMGFHKAKEARYPVNIEYAIIDSCVTSSGNDITYRLLDKKREKCICALERTMKNIEFDESDDAALKREFSKNIKSC